VTPSARCFVRIMDTLTRSCEGVTRHQPPQECNRAPPGPSIFHDRAIPAIGWRYDSAPFFPTCVTGLAAAASKYRMCGHKTSQEGLHASRSSVTVQTGTWAVILAGGDGVRLRGLTRGITVTTDPSSFARSSVRTHSWATLVDGQRGLCLVAGHSSLSPVSRALLPAPFDGYGVLGGGPARKPRHRCSYPLCPATDSRDGSQDTVAFFPSDHYVSDDEAFMAHVEQASRQPVNGLISSPCWVSLRRESSRLWLDPGGRACCWSPTGRAPVGSPFF